MTQRLLVSVLLLSIVVAKRAYANPQPGFEYHFATAYWFVKTAPFNYVIDLAALALALWVTGQMQMMSWRSLPAYNILVFIGGYAADYTAKGYLDLPMANVSMRDPIIGKAITDYGHIGIRPEQAVSYMFLASVLILLINLAIIRFILRWNDAESQQRLPIAAAIMALFTAPYLSLRGHEVGVLAWIIPFLFSLVVAAGWMAFVKARSGRKRVAR